MTKSLSVVCLMALSTVLVFACEKQGEDREPRDVHTVQQAETASAGKPPVALGDDVKGTATKADTLPAMPPAGSGLPIDDLPAPSATAAPVAKGAGGSATAGPVGPASIGEAAPGVGVTQLSPGQLLHFADTANSGEIAQARTAVSKARDPKVRSFASLMLEEHTASQEKGRVLGQKLGLSMAGNPISADLTKRAETLSRSVAVTSRDRFDRAYMQAQVELHEYVLQTLDESIAPQAKTPELKAYLSELREHVAHHLDAARDTMRRLGEHAATATR